MASLSDLARHVALVAPSAPLPIIVEQIRLAVDELALRTKCWIDEPGPVDVEDGEPRYTIPLSAGLVPIEIGEVRLDGKVLKPAAIPDWFNNTNAWPDATTGKPETYAQIATNRIVLSQVPNLNGEAWALDFKLSVRPGQDTSDIPDWLFADQYAAFICGAKSNILTLPTWLNAPLAGLERGKFDAAIAALGWRVSKGFTKRPGNHPPDFF